MKLACLLLVMALLVALNPPRDYEAPYIGSPLDRATEGEAEITCESNLAGSTGYYREEQGTKIVSEFTKQRETARWKISMQHDHAEVIDDQLNKNDFLVIKRGQDGVALVSVATGVSTQIITIDPQNSSFVYTTQHVHSLWNRASTFAGRCY